MKHYKVALLANLKKNAPKFEGMALDQWDDLDSEKTVNALVEAIRAGGYTCEFLEGNITLIDTLPKFKPDICFNIAEGHFGDARESHVPSILEMLRIPYTGSKVLTLALALDKPMTKRVIAFHDLPTPEFQTFERADEDLFPEMSFPLFVKPSREGTAMGVSRNSIVYDEKEMREQISIIIDKYKEPALVERYIEGREVTVGFVGNLIRPVAHRLPDDYNERRIIAGLHFLPPMEVDLAPFAETDTVYSNRLKVEMADKLNYLCPAPISEELKADLNWYAAAVFRVIGALDVSRVDFRLDMHNDYKPYILEINPLPGLAPIISDLVIEAAGEGIGHTELVNMILETALKRYSMI
jgi:D-alanine-D-alanine ligase